MSNGAQQTHLERRVRARTTSLAWVLRHLSGKARGLRIPFGMERTSNAARPDGSTPKQGKLFLREPKRQKKALTLTGKRVSGPHQDIGSRLLFFFNLLAQIILQTNLLNRF